MSALYGAGRAWVIVVNNRGCEWYGYKDSATTKWHQAVLLDLYNIIRDAGNDLRQFRIVSFFEMCKEISEVRKEGIVVDQSQPFRTRQACVVE